MPLVTHNTEKACLKGMPSSHSATVIAPLRVGSKCTAAHSRLKKGADFQIPNFTRDVLELVPFFVY